LVERALQLFRIKTALGTGFWHVASWFFLQNMASNTEVQKSVSYTPLVMDG
jgi:hypothetical protein